MISDEILVEYLDGHADPDAMRRIEGALAADARLRARLAAFAATDRDLRLAFDALLESPVPDRLVERVRAALSSTTPGSPAEAVMRLRPRARPVGPVDWMGGVVAAARRAWRTGPPWLAWVAAAQFAALSVAVILLQTSARTYPYHALGAAPAPATVNVMVIFRPETPERDLREALRMADARIVNGPTAADAYLLHVPQAGRAAALARLRGRPDIVTAEPVDSASEPR